MPDTPLATPGGAAGPARGAHADGERGHWPWLLRVRPQQVLLATAAFLATVWAVFLAVDIVNLGGIGDSLSGPVWSGLFNRGVTEVVQWVLSALTVAAAAYLAGALAFGERRWPAAASFFFLLAIGLGLMLIEEAGDVRHLIGAWVSGTFGDTILGTHHALFAHAPVFAIIAWFPVYALLRYGKHIWRVPGVRRYLVAAYSTYGVVASTALLAHVGLFYVKLGAVIDRWVFGGRFPPEPGQPEGLAHYFLVDSVLEESIELIAPALMLAMVLAFARALREGTLGSERGGPGRGPSESATAAPAR
ncbi:hypothetical protein [Haloechinothrix sp. LS1_15]|uniref:hypothetical protein n=1 Tax=Haloechinothrix sp. LS1_15 TaxID=2652248 RepID=UPI0029481519|nr:hypothetical protein [Haloechinothrix sp. LS1_15]MDV6013719.1 hypothetical protein [Haloechinothrix sp. LS1_15]